MATTTMVITATKTLADETMRVISGGLASTPALGERGIA